MISDEEIKFACSGCGSCCRRVGPAMEQMKELGFPYEAKEDGSCEMLDESNNCKVYENRPEVCNVESMYKRFHQPMLKTRKATFLEEAKICNTFMAEDGVSEEYYIDLKQYQ